ncbi:hypothetical protein [Pyxidicoccus xibeiensis]|uniref:hypothetical protein n=1 Tax=Pyxidicoccus xibeiensis TaxID=2906759 RepID=UPI0020A809F5|nr:hypothetical protein [Pyxidicoccus xibeiensis]MCP3144111.1 hypothetical protein [Pyxidicoccus xibeiensis]
MKMLKMGLLGLMLGAGAAFATATVGSEEAVAAPCCSSCDEGYASCVEACTDSACVTQCRTDWNWCFRRCSFSC